MKEKIMDSMKSLEELQNIRAQIKELNIPSINKEKILKVVDFEFSMIKHDVVESLGEAEYKKLYKGG